MPQGEPKYTKEKIKCMIWERGSNLRQISHSAGLNGEAAAQSLANPKPAANRAISLFLGIPMHRLWPDWYDQNETRILSRSNAQNLPRQNAPVSANSAHAI